MTEDDKITAKALRDFALGIRVTWGEVEIVRRFETAAARIESLSAEVERVTKERSAMEESLRLTLESMAADRQASEARVRALEEALRAQSAVIQNAQEVMASYLPPDGIPQEEAVSKVLFILDGPDQRVAKALTDAALGASNG